MRLADEVTFQARSFSDAEHPLHVWPTATLRGYKTLKHLILTLDLAICVISKENAKRRQLSTRDVPPPEAPPFSISCLIHPFSTRRDVRFLSRASGKQSGL